MVAHGLTSREDIVRTARKHAEVAEMTARRRLAVSTRQGESNRMMVQVKVERHYLNFSFVR